MVKSSFLFTAKLVTFFPIDIAKNSFVYFATSLLIIFYGNLKVKHFNQITKISVKMHNSHYSGASR